MGGKRGVGGDAGGGAVCCTVGACVRIDGPIEAEAVAGEVDCCQRHSNGTDIAGSLQRQGIYEYGRVSSSSSVDGRC